jgi:hypothetical protein
MEVSLEDPVPEDNFYRQVDRAIDLSQQDNIRCVFT